MAISNTELQNIVDAVLSTIRTHSCTIDDLTPVTSLSANDSIEIAGGRRITYGTLLNIILAEGKPGSTLNDIIEGVVSQLEIVNEHAGEAASSAADAKSKADSALAAAQLASATAESAADLAGIINTKVNDNSDSIAWLEGRLNDYMTSDGNSVQFLPCDGQKSQEWLEEYGDPSDGVWLCPNLESGWYFRCFGDTDWYGHSEEEYNSDMVYNPGYFYVVGNNLMRIKNNKLVPVFPLNSEPSWNTTSDTRYASPV